MCLTGGSMDGTAPQFPSPKLSGVCFVAKCDINKSFITGPWDKDCSFTDSHCFCLWFDTNYSFLPYFLPLRQFLNCGTVLCFIFPLLSFLISLLSCAESWNNYDAAESFFQLQKRIKGLKGTEIPPREIVLICPCHILVIWMGKSQTENIYFWTRVPKQRFESLHLHKDRKTREQKKRNVFLLPLIVDAPKSVKFYFEIIL